MSEPNVPENAIAVVGMAAHLPGAQSVEEFWERVLAAEECIRHFTADELLEAGVAERELASPGYVKANGVLDRMEWFDAGFFGLSPRDAAVMDPQTRHFLECAWHALENAGHVPERFEGSIGVFAGAGAAQYFWKNVVQDPELMESVGYFLLRHTGNDKDFVATRAAYELNLTGPAVGVQTACSTSLVAVHYACQSLLSWECDMALAGGVTIEQPHIAGYRYEEGEILSPDGHCRSFDHRASGTVFGSGAGVVALRRAGEAFAEGDHIHALILGSAVNNDGAGKVSYLAPSVDGQAKAIAEAISVADVNASTIGMVEAHGTATPVGDPIEVAALTQAFRVHTEETGFCALGSVKSNIGHLDTAAGVASLIKAVQSVRHGTIPPTLHFEQPNPLLTLETTPFYVNARALTWPSAKTPRRAGVSSLGVGGTNAHVVIEEPPPRATPGASRPWQLLTLSGRSATVLGDASHDLVDFLERTDASLADVSFTLRTGRRRFEHRRAVVCGSADEAVESLATGRGIGFTDGVTDRDRRGVAFLFAGGGAQYPNMGRELYDRETGFRTVADRCLRHIESEAGYDLRALLFPTPEDETAAAEELRRPSRALPALFAVQYAQARLWQSWGIEPVSLIGHSMGEYTAACIAGVFSPEAAMSLVHLRGRLFESLDRGAMLSVGLAEDDLRKALTDDLSIAALNAPDVSVASGPVEAIEALRTELESAGIDCRRVRIDVAAHSSMLDPILPEFAEYLRTVDLSSPSVPVVSNVTGQVAADELTDPDYWVRHLRQTVRFSDGVGSLMGDDGPVLLEVGPGRTLSTVAKMHGSWSPTQPALHSLPHPTERVDAQAFQLGTLGALWVHGVDPDWSAFDAGHLRLRLPLPGYPFERQPYFVSPPARAAVPAATVGAQEAGGRREPSEWFYGTEWHEADLPPPADGKPPCVLLLARADGPRDGPGEALARALEDEAATVLRVRPGDAFGLSPDGHSVRPDSPNDWRELMAALSAEGTVPTSIVHAWCLDDGGALPSAAAAEAEAFHAPLYLMQAMERAHGGRPYHFFAVTTRSVAVSPDERVDPHRALLLGPVRVAPREIPSLRTRLIDVGDGEAVEDAARSLVSEMSGTSDDVVVAYRGGRRLVERFGRMRLRDGSAGDGLRDGGVYVITGGLGGLGIVVARELVESMRARVVLVGRSGLPPEPEWSRWLREHADEDKTARAIREVIALRELGGEVVAIAADVTHGEAMRAVIDSTVERFGAVHGVFHAAGTLDDGPMMAKDHAQVRNVLDAKVRGALAIEEATAGRDLDFIVLFSSVSAVIGAPGQIDYAAANAFLDAFARDRDGRDGTRVLSLGWGAWKDVGMAAELAGEAQYASSIGRDDEIVAIEHPLFDAEVLGRDGARGYRTVFTTSRHWMVEEHKVRDGAWVLPGSGYVELIRASAQRLRASQDFEVTELVFLTPFRIGEAQSAELEVRLVPGADCLDVTVRGRAGAGQRWVVHATATVPNRPRPLDDVQPLEGVVERIGDPAPGEPPRHPVMEFGPRWANVVATATKGAESLLRHALPDPFASDLPAAALHPALLDMATAGAPHLVTSIDPETEFLIPAGYGRLTMVAPLGPVMTSHVRLREGDADAALASFDVTIYDPQGRVAAVVDDFSMIRVPITALESTTDTSRPRWLEDAISPSEGRDVLRRVLAHPEGGHVLVATRPLDRLIEEAAQAGVRVPAGARRKPARLPIPDVAEALMRHDAVKEAVAIGSPDDVEAPRVVAFVVYEPGRTATVSELRRFARKAVARPLVPQNFVEMAALPRTESGSIELADLRDPFAGVDDYVAPRTETEAIVASIWSELLGLERVGIHDSFLDVGGHSLVGIRVLLRIDQATGVRLEANDLTLQTLEQLAAGIDRVSAPADGSAARSTGDTTAAEGRDDDGVAGSPGGLLSRVRKAIAER